MNKPLAPNQLLGQQGEQQAIQFLQHKKYKILEKNFRALGCEIDIIAQDKGEIVFVEVKTRTQLYGIHPSEAVTVDKLDHIFKAGIEYLRQKRMTADFRCDVIAISANTIEHFENVSLD